MAIKLVHPTRRDAPGDASEVDSDAGAVAAASSNQIDALANALNQRFDALDQDNALTHQALSQIATELAALRRELSDVKQSSQRVEQKLTLKSLLAWPGLAIGGIGLVLLLAILL